MTETQPPPTDAAQIVHQMQVLTDIEGDLADTAVAVAAPDVSMDQGSADTMMQNAETMESVLEQSIPAGPDPATKETPEIPDYHAPSPQTNGDVTVSTPVPTEPSSNAHNVSTTMSAITADLNEPVMPESTVPAAHDVVAETAVEESSGDIVIDVEEPTMQNIAEAFAKSEDVPQTQAIPSDAVTPAAIIGVHPLQHNEEPVAASRQPTPTLPAQTAYITSQSPKRDASLPEGLTESSASIRAIPDLIRSWRAGAPLYGWSGLLLTTL